MTTPGLTIAQLQELERYDTPTVCNAIELFQVRPRNAGFMDGSIRCNAPKLPPMVGYAATATFRSADPPRGIDVYGSVLPQIERFGELPGRPVVVFQDLDNPIKAATFGEIMCRSYQTGGAAGLITSGAARDLDQVDAIRFPTFSRQVICAHGYCHIPHIHVPVHVGGLTIYPGDLLHGDRNGVTTIPTEVASEVAAVCGEIMKAERYILDYLDKGRVESKGYLDAVAACSAHIKGVGEQVRRAPARGDR